MADAAIERVTPCVKCSLAFQRSFDNAKAANPERNVLCPKEQHLVASSNLLERTLRSTEMVQKSVKC